MKRVLRCYRRHLEMVIARATPSQDAGMASQDGVPPETLSRWRRLGRAPCHLGMARVESSHLETATAPSQESSNYLEMTQIFGMVPSRDAKSRCPETLYRPERAFSISRRLKCTREALLGRTCLP